MRVIEWRFQSLHNDGVLAETRKVLSFLFLVTTYRPKLQHSPGGKGIMLIVDGAAFGADSGSTGLKKVMQC